MAYVITPNSRIYLVKTKLESDYEHTFRFTNRQAQTDYFNSLIPSGLSFVDYTYVRKDKYVVVDKCIDELIQYNYLFYENAGFPEAKRYYCFITRMEYVSENDTRIYFETDVMQTYLYDLEFNRCFVEREHVSNDTVGLHTIPEGLETGDFIINGNTTMATMGSSHIVVGSTIGLISADTNYNMFDVVGGLQSGVFSGLGYYLFKNTEDVQKAIKRCEHYGKAEGIVLMFMAPDALTHYDDIQWNNHIFTDPNADVSFYCFRMGETTGAQLIPALSQSIAKPTSLDGYTPKNNKLLCYPYNYLNVSNFNGADGEYRYEYFNGNTCNFEGNGCISSGCSIILTPTNYQTQANSGGLSSKYKGIFNIPCGKYPVCSYSSDYYTNWLSQNGLNISTKYMQAGVNLLGGIAGSLLSGNPTGITSGIANSFSQVTDTIAAQDVQQMKPNTIEGNTNSGDVNFAEHYIGYGFYPMSIKAEFARIIDNYFSMYGYKVHTTKIPNISSRRYWNYIKTIKCNVDGDIPQEDLQIIRNNFDKGITFWHNPANIYNYSLNNTIV